jgi:branched-chain amino acid transport system ATP-binding protein
MNATKRMVGAPLLDVDHLTMRFGGLTAVNDLSFQARRGEITAIIGPNGAGKTTLFNCLTGFYRPPVGRMQMVSDGRRPFLLERMESFRIARDARVIRTFQNVRLFAGLSVLENLMVAQHRELMRASGFSLAGLVGLPRHRKAMNKAVERARYWLDKLDLDSAADSPAGNLAYGLQRRLEIARALCAGPRLLCLDEPAAGLNPRESQELIALIRALRHEQGVSVLLVEHDMNVVMQVSDHVIVLDHGVGIADGTPEEVRANPAVIRAYLGAPEAIDIVPSAGAAC